MTWLAILQAILGFAQSIATYLNNSQLITAGEAQAILKGIQNAQTAIDKARGARAAANRKFDERDGLPDDDDPNLRD